MTPDERVAETKRLANELVDNDPIHAETCAEIVQHVDKIAEALDETEGSLNEAERELAEANERLAEIEGALTWEDERPIWYEAKGRIMEGQDPKTVLAWVLTWVSGEDILL